MFNKIKKYLPEILCFYAIMIIVGVGAGSEVAPGGWWKGLCFLLPLGTLVLFMELDKKK